MMYLELYGDNRKRKNKERFIPGEYAYSTAFKKSYKIIDTTDRMITIEDENGNITEFLIKDFIPEIEHQTNKYNI